MGSTPALLTAGCLLAVTGLVTAEWRSWPVARRLWKVVASTAFVLLALSLNASTSTYGQLVLIALLLSWLGDTCLLSGRGRLFLSGLGFFLLAHVAYSVAFATAALDKAAFWVALALLAASGAWTLRWLWRHLAVPYRAAIGAYVVAIVAMCSLAVARSVASDSWPLAVGALAFAASDLAVARERFVTSAFVNRLWGLPVYYSAQLLLAWTVT